MGPLEPDGGVPSRIWVAQSGADPRRSRASRISLQVAGCGLGFPALADGGEGPGIVGAGPPLVPGDDRGLEQGGVVPVVRLPGDHTAFSSVSNDRREPGDFRVTGFTNLHERHGVDARVGVAEICLEPATVCVDGLVEKRTGCVITFSRGALPAILADASEQAKGLAARSMPFNQRLENFLGALALAESVERKRVLLLYQDRLADWLGHGIDETHHVRPRADRPVREQQIDQDSHFTCCEIRELFLGPRHGRPTCRCPLLSAQVSCTPQSVLLIGGDLYSLPEDIGLLVGNSRITLEQLKEWAVGRRLTTRRLQHSLDGLARLVHPFRESIGPDRVMNRPKIRHVEWQPRRVRVN